MASNKDISDRLVSTACEIDALCESLEAFNDDRLKDVISTLRDAEFDLNDLSDTIESD